MGLGFRFGVADFLAGGGGDFAEGVEEHVLGAAARGLAARLAAAVVAVGAQVPRVDIS